ncbi:hypothetical protein LTR09_010518 [Extremus antarcticus]|uniref:Uncharacterized protein n=1 Tax=Extremus antarcticus TaxID=702011 RepID=A0AAJ0D7N8_9PEZI|nr:hypothetical protein LTR09_010518 [Extremus antarcticus]
MKCKKPHTDQDCTLAVFADGLPCAEYILPSQANFPNEQSDILECFIPVSDGEQIVLSGSFNGTCLHASFDLLADGSFVIDKRIEGSTSGATKFYNPRNLDFVSVFNMPASGTTAPDKVVEGILLAQRLPEGDSQVDTVLNAMDRDGYNIGLGSLTVIVSLNQVVVDNYQESFADMACGSWKSRNANVACHGGIAPTHELTVMTTDGNLNVNLQSKMRRHFKQTRFGKGPWATFVFYYRSPYAIQEAGCTLRPDEWQELKDEGALIPAAPIVSESPAPSLQLQHAREQDGEAAQTTGTNGTDETVETPPAPAQQTAQPKLFGQPLFAPQPERSPSKSSDGLFVGQSSYRSMPASPTHGELDRDHDEDYSGRTPDLETENNHIGNLDIENDLIAPDEFDQGTTVAMVGPPTPSFRKGGAAAMSQDTQTKDADVATPAEQPHLRRPTTEAATALSATPNPADRTPENATPRPPPELMYRSKHTRPVRVPRNFIDYDEIRALASPGGTVPLEKIAEYCDEQGIPQDVGLSTAQEICFKTGTSYTLLQPREGPAYRAKPIGNKSKVDAAREESPLFVQSDEEITPEPEFEQEFEQDFDEFEPESEPEPAPELVEMAVAVKATTPVRENTDKQSLAKTSQLLQSAVAQGARASPSRARSVNSPGGFTSPSKAPSFTGPEFTATASIPPVFGLLKPKAPTEVPQQQTEAMQALPQTPTRAMQMPPQAQMQGIYQAPPQAQMQAQMQALLQPFPPSFQPLPPTMATSSPLKRPAPSPSPNITPSKVPKTAATSSPAPAVSSPSSAPSPSSALKAQLLAELSEKKTRHAAELEKLREEKRVRDDEKRIKKEAAREAKKMAKAAARAAEERARREAEQRQREEEEHLQQEREEAQRQREEAERLRREEERKEQQEIERLREASRKEDEEYAAMVRALEAESQEEEGSDEDSEEE